MSAQRDYYKVLGVSVTASQDEIKQAYRRLAKQHHPDSQGGNKAAEEKFKMISEAYSVLGDAEKRQKYDMMHRHGFSGDGFNFGGNSRRGEPGQNPFGGGFSGNLHDIFSNLFGDSPEDNPFSGGGFDDRFTRTQRQKVARGADMESTITVPFEMAVNGGETVIKTGSGKRIKIKIPEGAEDGKKIRLRGQGAPSPNSGEPGDLYLTIKVAAHAEFERRGFDIYSNVYINIAEAVLGTEVFANTVSGKKVKLKIPPGTSSGKVFRLPNMGIKAEGKEGNHYVRIEIDVPPNLSMGQKREFKFWAKKLGLI